MTRDEAEKMIDRMATAREAMDYAQARRAIVAALSEKGEGPIADGETGIGLDALVAYVVRRKTEVERDGGIYDNGFVCVDEAGVAFEVDAESFADLQPASPPRPAEREPSPQPGEVCREDDFTSRVDCGCGRKHACGRAPGGEGGGT